MEGGLVMNTIITISRQAGSGGREIGKGLAETFNIPFYDKEIIAMAAEKSGMNKEIVENLDEKAANRFLYAVPSGLPSLGQAAATGMYTMPLSDTLFLAEYEIIKKLAEEGPCILVGRCSDYVLKDLPNHVSIFIHADKEFRAARIAEYESIGIKDAMNSLHKYDKERRRYHDYYAANSWGNAEYYDLTLNTGVIGIAKAIEIIASFVTIREK